MKYPIKGLMVLDPSLIVIKDNTLGPSIVYSATERIRSGIVKIPNTHIEARKSDFVDYWL